MKFLLISLIFGTYFSWNFTLSAGTGGRTASSFGSCKSTDAARELIDNFCPRVEGTHLEGCCPPVEKRPAMDCIYHIFRPSGQPKRVNDSYRYCDGSGTTRTANCCRTTQVGCYTDEVHIPFIARLLARNNACCFETCPSTQYWLSPPNPRTDITQQHQYTGGGVNGCINAVIEECSYGTTDNCGDDDPCPPAPCTSNCGGSTGSTGGSTGGTTGGTTGATTGGTTSSGTSGGDPGDPGGT